MITAQFRRGFLLFNSIGNTLFMNTSRSDLFSKLHIVSSLVILLSFNSFAQEQQDASLTQRAATHYQAQAWKESADAYQQLVAQEPENHMAWYRLGVSLNEMGQPSEALAAMEKAKAGGQIPTSLIDYEAARAHMALRQSDKMWSALHAAAQAGYRNEQVLQDSTVWQSVRSTDKFKQVLDRVAKNAHPCVYDERFLQFDFWLGSWQVFGNTERTGPMYGTNKIAKKEDGCLVLESWSGASGTTGTSMNYYDGTKQQWVQHWVSKGGVTINIEGGIVDDSMRMQGKIFYLTGNPPQTRDFRALWTPLDNGVVRQFFEESIDQGKTWYPWFEGFYFPQASDSEE